MIFMIVVADGILRNLSDQEIDNYRSLYCRLLCRYLFLFLFHVTMVIND